MSVWLQSLGEFFWVFVMNEVGDLELYKVMGETVTFKDGEEARCHEFIPWIKPKSKGQFSTGQFFKQNSNHCHINFYSLCFSQQARFVCYDVKPVPLKMNKLGTWSIRSGMFAKVPCTLCWSCITCVQFR